MCSEKRALKKALAQISVRSKKHALKKACAQKSVQTVSAFFGAKIQIILVCELLLVNNDDFGMDNVPIVFRIDQTRYVGPSGHHLQKKRPLNLHISIASLN